MSIIQRTGRAVLNDLARQEYFIQRRSDLEQAWITYMSEVYDRDERRDEAPFRYGFDELSRQTDAFIIREARTWARRCRKYRLYEDEFESQFRLTVVKAALRYKGEHGAFFDYLRISIRNAARDLIRCALTKKNRINHLALSLDDEQTAQEVEHRMGTTRSAEDEAITRIVVDQMAADTTLTNQERGLFEYLRSDPDATLQEMADAIGVRDRKQASRIKGRIAKKLRKYIVD